MTSGIGPATINKEVQSLQPIAKKAVEWGKIRTNLIAGVKPLKTPPGRVRYLELEQIPKHLEACPAWLRPIVLIDMNTGLRRSEIMNLERKHIDKKNHLITVDNTKNNERKAIPMNDTVWETIQSLPNRLNTTYLFVDDNGTQIKPDKVTVAFGRAC